MAVALIMAGGRGERFWPMSRSDCPKHLLKLTGRNILLDETIKRVSPLVPPRRQWIITNSFQAGMIKKVSGEKANILIEPEGRNTAAAIGLAANHFKKLYGEETVMLVVSSDHWVGERGKFLQTLRSAVKLAEKEDFLVTVGIKPSRAETGFGYIEKGEKIPERGTGGKKIFLVERFVEKPSYRRAKVLWKNDRFLWNSGIFVWKTGAILKSLAELMPFHFEILAKVQVFNEAKRDREARRLYQSLPKVSIDCGVMEKSRRAAVVRGDFSWEDIGSWSSWADLKKKDKLGNVVAGKVVLHDTEDSVVLSDGPLVCSLGIRDMVVIAHRGAVLVCPRGRSQEVKKIVSKVSALPESAEYL